MYVYMEDILTVPKYTSSQKGFLKVYKICKNIYQPNWLHSDAKISKESLSCALIFFSFH